MRWADRMTDAMVAMSKAFLNLPIGEVEAAVEGRPVTCADKRRTIRSETNMSERDVREKIEATRPAMQAGMRAVSAALPAMMKGLSERSARAGARDRQHASSRLSKALTLSA